jgi:ribose transport system permease protein
MKSLRTRLRALPPGTLAVWSLAVLAFPASRLVSESFPSTTLLRNVLILALFLVLVAFGQGLIILSGGVDLSVPSSVALGAFATGYFTSHGLPTLVAVVGAIALAGLVGLINGAIISRSGFPPFIVTLSIGSIVASGLLGFSAGNPGQTSPPELSALFAVEATILGIPTAALILAATLILCYLVQSGTTLGRRTYAIGNSARAAEIAGIPVARTLQLVYCIAGAAFGLAGVLLMGYGSGADLNIGAPWLLPSIAAVVVGGSSIKGGSGSFAGTVGGAFLLTILGICISAAGLSEGYKQVLYGAVVLVALLGGLRRASR